jgi:hypothetical protein
VSGQDQPCHGIGLKPVDHYEHECHAEHRGG